jgi:large subunit ribosomal protein L38
LPGVYTVVIPLEKTKETWWETSGPHQVRQVAQHYGVFDHLFGDAYFTPRTSLNISYSQNDDTVAPVFYGNVLKPSEVSMTYLIIDMFNLTFNYFQRYRHNPM